MRPNHIILAWTACVAIASVALLGGAQLLYDTPVASQLVMMGGDGKLIYAMYANEGETNEINRIPDFSYAGYSKGGQTLPVVNEVIHVFPVPGDNLANIQDAIDNVSQRVPDVNGFRGAVVLEEGTYDVNGTIIINASGVVLRGAGQGLQGTILRATKTDYPKETGDLVLVTGTSSAQVLGSRRDILDPYVATGATQISVNSSDAFSVGDRIVVMRTPNQAWVDAIGMTRYWWDPDSFNIAHERIVVDILGNTITIDIPMVDVIQDRYGGGYVAKLGASGRIRQCGVENLRMESVYASDTDENHAWNAIVFHYVEDSWVSRVTARYFAKSCVRLDKSSFNTVQDSAMLDPKSVITGSRRYSFNVAQGIGNLIQRCFARGGRHDFVTPARSPGPNVWLDCLAVNTHDDIGPHGRWATGSLFDSIKGGQIRVRNRRDMGSDGEGDPGQGWAGAQQMLWNVVSTKQDIIVESPIGARNWGIGCFGYEMSGAGFWEHQFRQVTPRSLYLQQLQDRLGTGAVANVSTPEQRTGTIYHLLERWAGEGALSDVSLPAGTPVDSSALGVVQYWIVMQLVIWNAVAIIGVVGWQARASR